MPGRRHRRSLTDTVSNDVRLDQIHRVENGKTCSDRTTVRVDVNVDIAIRVFARKEEDLRDQQIGDLVVNRGAKEDDVFLE